jgi:hypothetical protein
MLWLWFYDSRWFFDFNISIACYKKLWLLPLFTNILLIGVCVYFITLKEIFTCDNSLVFWLFSRILFSSLISIIIISFIKKISESNSQENLFIQRVIKIFPSVKGKNSSYETLIKRRSINSVRGIILLVLSVISLLWSYTIVAFHLLENYYGGCNLKINTFLNFHSYLIVLGNMPFIIICLIFGFMKIGSYSSSYICPNFLIKLSNQNSPVSLVNRNK